MDLKYFFKNIRFIVAKNWLFIILIVIAAFLRFYRLESFVTFLSDQGRDAIIIKRILTLEHLPAIGAPSSVGQVYLGPFYYYFIAPFLLLFNFNPVGLAYGAAIISTIGIAICYFIIKKNTNAKVGIFFLILVAFSSVNIELARFSWNPNLLPLFAFLTLYFFYQTLTLPNTFYAFLLGAFFSFSIQFHHLAFLIMLPIFIISIIFLVKKNLSIKKIFIALISFSLFSSPLIIFDLRHNFINSKNFLKLFTENKIVSNNSLFSRILETNQSFLNNLLKLNLNNYLAIILIILLIGSCIYLVNKTKNKLFIYIHLLNIIFFIIGFSLLNSSRHPHYYGPIYYSIFFVIGYLFFILAKQKILKYFIIPLILIAYIYINGLNYPFLFNEGGNQIQYAQKIANFLAEKVNNKPFNIATWPVELTEDNFLYFLELKGLRPADRKKIEITQQMFVLCNQQPCLILNSPSWNISMFGKAKIDKIWKVENLIIYKLVHDK